MAVHPSNPEFRHGAYFIVVVDDDDVWRTAAAGALHRHGYEVASLADRARIWELGSIGPIDMLVVAAKFPASDARIVRRLARWTPQTRLVLLCPQAKLIARSESLGAGADECLVKPNHPEALPHEIEPLLKAKPPLFRPSAGNVLEFAGWRLFATSKRLVAPNGANIELKPSEFAVLMTFLANQKRVLSHGQLHRLSGMRDEVAQQAVGCRIARLRRTLAKLDASGRTLVRTVRSEGYMFLAASKLSANTRDRADSAERH